MLTNRTSLDESISAGNRGGTGQEVRDSELEF